MVLFVILMLRVVWRFINITPATSDPKATSVELKAAHVAHITLYFLMAALMFTGYLISTADGRAIEIFGLVSVPALPFSIDQQENIAGDIHEILAWTIIALSALHALAAFKHHFVNKNNTLIRMLKVSTK
jgi:cytochrome b561